MDLFVLCISNQYEVYKSEQSKLTLTCRPGDSELVDPLVAVACDRHRHVPRWHCARRLLRRPLDCSLEDRPTPPPAERDRSFTETNAYPTDGAVQCGSSRAITNSETSNCAALRGS